MQPELDNDEFVFCSVAGDVSQYAHLKPLASFNEAEGLTLIVTLQSARQAGIAFESTFRKITLTVHSSLEAVGLTAAVSSKLTEKEISANVVAAYYHDHIFVPSEKAESALAALKELISENSHAS